MPERRTLNRTYSVGDQVPTCPVFTRAKIKSRFRILVNLPSQSGISVLVARYIYIYIYTYLHIYIYIYIYIYLHVMPLARISLILSRHSPYRSSHRAGLQGYIPYHHMFGLVVLLWSATTAYCGECSIYVIELLYC